MRTPEQINNLRIVFSNLYTPLALFWPDEAVNFLGDKIQEGIDKTSPWTWEIRIITKTNFEESWEKVKPEPKTPCCTIYSIKKKCQELLDKYPTIVSILIVAKENPKLVFQFNS